MREWTLDDFDLAESAITVLLPTRKELANLIFGLIVGLALARKDPDTHGDADEAEGWWVEHFVRGHMSGLDGLKASREMAMRAEDYYAAAGREYPLPKVDRS